MKTGFKETTLKTYEYLQGFLDLALTRFLVSTQYEKCGETQRRRDRRDRRDRKENQEMETQTVEKKIQGRCNSP